ncbi:MAG: hypothetical protein K2J32_09305 [Ruminococcus sp.]|nr:hypothetical protein [Ruminococcus sp.]
MKSEALFRGKTRVGDWYYGDLVKYNDKKMSITYIGETRGNYEIYVNPETVGAFTGYRALNYEQIFDSDILKTMTGHFLLVIDSGCGNWTFTDIQDGEVCRWVNAEILSSCRIIDNIHDNPDFVETYRRKF